jgi:hypothetical protein
VVDLALVCWLVAARDDTAFLGGGECEPLEVVGDSAGAVVVEPHGLGPVGQHCVEV